MIETLKTVATIVVTQVVILAAVVSYIHWRYKGMDLKKAWLSGYPLKRPHHNHWMETHTHGHLCYLDENTKTDMIYPLTFQDFMANDWLIKNPFNTISKEVSKVIDSNKKKFSIED